MPNAEYRELLKEFKECKQLLLDSNAGVSMLERYSNPVLANKASEKEALTGKLLIRAIVVKVTARYLILSSNYSHFLDLPVANEAHRALFNNGIQDEDLSWWATPSYGLFKLGKADHKMPPDLEAEIADILSRFPTLRKC